MDYDRVIMYNELSAGTQQSVDALLNATSVAREASRDSRVWVRVRIIKQFYQQFKDGALEPNASTLGEFLSRGVVDETNPVTNDQAVIAALHGDLALLDTYLFNPISQLVFPLVQGGSRKSRRSKRKKSRSKRSKRSRSNRRK
jgi:hypothetical protein